ncbi:MAG: Uracil-DNA glycosylase, family 4 [uncultured Campylobacterales bacterium]|uniref:Type-4 uracil-DNA glycosylase n=1 Tax=uncultured Campylobacterales bacterium TaxID=352960 RepID=A0A6S6SDS1_9BACT|nr:MAG: Uracil-DNA glycosylase, family 4 [uncultured Campylobacterales bacterium]
MSNSQNLQLLKELYIYKSMGFSYVDKLQSVQNNTKNRSIVTWDDLEKTVKNCFLCELSKSRKNTVFGNGNKNAKVMFIGEAPGMVEDESGDVFVGRSGELLTKMIENVLNIPRDEVYITNMLKCKPPSNASATKNQINSCSDYLTSQINLVSPKLIVALGQSVYQYLSNDDSSLSEARMSISKYKEISVITTYHPSYLLRNPSIKKQAHQDLLKIKSFLDNL